MIEPEPDGWSIAFGFVIGAVLAAGVAGGLVEQHWKSASVEKGHAEYNQQTGEWQWKALEPKGTP